MYIYIYYIYIFINNNVSTMYMVTRPLDDLFLINLYIFRRVVHFAVFHDIDTTFFYFHLHSVYQYALHMLPRTRGMLLVSINKF